MNYLNPSQRRTWDEIYDLIPSAYIDVMQGDFSKTKRWFRHIDKNHLELGDKWNIINKFGNKQWPQVYTNFKMEDVLHLTSDYFPSGILKNACLWSIWINWCKYFYETQVDDNDFIANVVDEALRQLMLRANEIGPVTQWIQIVRNRRIDGNTSVNEKEFILREATSVKKYQEFMTLSDEANTDPILRWDGSKVFFKINTTNDKSKLHINNKEIMKFIKSECTLNIESDHWTHGGQDNNILTHPAICNETT